MQKIAIGIKESFVHKVVFWGLLEYLGVGHLCQIIEVKTNDPIF
jgi:hypothetical protein